MRLYTDDFEGSNFLSFPPLTLKRGKQKNKAVLIIIIISTPSL